MIRFQSDAAGDVLMLDGPAADILQAMGRRSTAQGVLMPEQLPSAIIALEAAAERADAEPAPEPVAAASAVDEHADAWQRQPQVSLRQRAYPVLEMLRMALARQRSVTWRSTQQG
jgi:hypothetical protein